MQKEEPTQTRPDTRPVENRGPQPRTTASEGQSCERCGKPLTGRKLRYCSDRCRMQNRREDERRHLLELFNTIIAALNELRLSLGVRHD
jgi:predicted nucleic acid-binding Zn ribbon protein